VRRRSITSPPYLYWYYNRVAVVVYTEALVVRWYFFFFFLFFAPEIFFFERMKIFEILGTTRSVNLFLDCAHSSCPLRFFSLLRCPSAVGRFDLRTATAATATARLGSCSAPPSSASR